MPKRKAKEHTGPRTTTIEADSYLQGLHKEFNDQVNKYQQLTRELLSLEARVELAEKTLCLTRDHLTMAIANTECAAPRDWNKTLRMVRFAGVRLADACISLLQEHKKLTQGELLDALNLGSFRFRTNSPLREIHAALLRHPFVKKTGQTWIWTGTDEKQAALRPRAETARTAREIAQELRSMMRVGADDDARDKETEVKK